MAGSAKHVALVVGAVCGAGVAARGAGEADSATRGAGAIEVDGATRGVGVKDGRRHRSHARRR
jgi:hypothetical protein